MNINKASTVGFRSTIEDAFSPTSEVAEPRFFAGRVAQLRKAISALHRPGSAIAIIGLRGMGKTSLGTQVCKVARGDNSLIRKVHLERDLGRGFNKIAHTYTCSRGIGTPSLLLHYIMLGDGQNNSLYYYAASREPIPRSFDARQYRKDTYAKYINAPRGDIGAAMSEFRSLTNDIRRRNPTKDGLLIMLDEFDRTARHLVVGDIVKTLSDDYIKFMFIGVGKRVTEMMVDHASISRQLATSTINLKEMDKEEMGEILTNAEKETKGLLKFSPEAREMILDLSRGLPTFVHLLGVESALTAWNDYMDKGKLEGLVVVSRWHMEEVRHEFCTGKLAGAHEDTYQELIDGDINGEKSWALKRISDLPGELIEVHKLTSQMKLPPNIAPSTIKSLISQLTDREILYEVSKDRLRIHEPTFMHYIKIRETARD